MTRFKDRQDAGRQLAKRLRHYAEDPKVLVLALPRGGVAVADEVARAIAAPLDVFLVRKLGAPGQPELAVGALASGGVRVLNDDVIDALGVTGDELDTVAAAEQKELERREAAYRRGKPPLETTGRTVILVDDGLATGATMHAAVRALRKQGANPVVVAVPVAAPDSLQRIRREADDVVCLSAPPAFQAVGQWYERFGQLSDADVCAFLARKQPGPPGG
ncbi:MAG: phosphoribosyltransferase [Lentisphaerae bacterium]|nr:phosphoribosyltransferase [Lentisphaerota bacterium]